MRHFRGDKRFLRAADDACSALIEFHKRYIDEQHKGNGRNDDQRMKSFSRTFIHGAQTFFEALQSLYFYQMLLWGHGERYLGLGRLDQYLYRFYHHDISHGLITREDAENLLVEFWHKINEEISYRSNNIYGDSGQTIILGGLDSDGNDATNSISYLFLDVTMKLSMPNPNILVRVHKGTPHAFLKKACELARMGMGFPTFCNDDVIIPALTKIGYKVEHARDYSVGGCWEPLIPGKSFDRPNVGKVVFLKCLEASINNGRSFLSNIRIGLDSGSLHDCESFEDLMRSFRRNVEFTIYEIADQANMAVFMPAPILSITNGKLRQRREGHI